MKLLPRCLVLLAVAVFSNSSAVDAVDSPAQHAPAPADLRVGIVLFDNTLSLDYVGPTTYLEFAQLANKTVQFTNIANRAGHVQPRSRPSLFSDVAFADAPTQFDVLVIPGGPGDAAVVADPAFISYLKTTAEQSTYVLSVCTGGRILAATGLLDGRNATTNKRKFKQISAEYPLVKWVRRARWVVDGKFWTSSGVTAGLDMGHAFLGFLLGQATADRAAALIESVPITDPNNDPFEYVIDLA